METIRRANDFGFCFATTWWTPERKEELARLWAEGKSASMIAQEMGCKSRNAVIGKAARMGLAARKTSKRRVVKYPVGAWRHRGHRISKPRLAIVEPLEPTGNQVSLLDVKFNQCRFVLGEPNGPQTMFCGAVVEAGCSWCAYHKRKVSTPARPQTPEERRFQAFLHLKRLKAMNRKLVATYRPTGSLFPHFIPGRKFG